MTAGVYSRPVLAVAGENDVNASGGNDAIDDAMSWYAWYSETCTMEIESTNANEKTNATVWTS